MAGETDRGEKQFSVDIRRKSELSSAFALSNRFIELVGGASLCTLFYTFTVYCRECSKVVLEHSSVVFENKNKT